MAITEHELKQAEKRMAAVREAGHAVSARYDRRRSRGVVALNTGVELAFPTRLAEGLADASPDNLADIEISPAGLGLHWPRLDADLYVPALLQGVFGSKSWMARQLGAEIRLGVSVTDLLVEGGRVRGVQTDQGPVYGDCVVNAAAVWAPLLTKKYGYEPPIIPRRGQILVTEPLPPKTVRHLLLCACYLTAKHHPELLDMEQRQHRLGVGLIVEQTVSGGLLLGSTREFVGFDRRTTQDGIAAVAEHIYASMPALGRFNVVRTFAGLRPRTPDGMPILGPVEALPGLLMAAGHEGDGIALAPITGEILADHLSAMH